MAKRTFKVQTWTPVSTADAAALANNSYMAILGGTTTQRLRINEVYVSGLAGASTPTLLTLSRDSTIGGTPTALTTGQYDTANDPATAALVAPAIPFVGATTSPQRSATLSLHSLAVNAFGGIVRLNFPPEQEPFTLGNTASFGELSLSSYSGGTPGAVSSHIVYEPL